jgi:hypothetical protein
MWARSASVEPIREPRSGAEVEGVLNGQRLRFGDRLAAGFLLVLLTVGSLMLWVGVPAGWLWLASQITESESAHLALGIVGMPVAIILFAIVLVWINRLYMRVVWSRGPPLPEELETGEGDEIRVPRGPLEPLLVVSLVLSVVALFVWFFVFAENPSWGPMW